MAAKVPDITLRDEFPLYCEDQKDSLCAKHAINHILQEEKIVWIPNNDNLYINKSDSTGTRSEQVMTKDVAINLWEFCGVSDAEARASVEAEPGEAACKGNGNLAFDRIPSLIRLLGYDIVLSGKDRADALYSEKKPKRLFMAQLMAKISNICVLGAVLNLGKSHYTAIVKNARGCKSDLKGDSTGKVVTDFGYAYMDSNGPKGRFIGYCGTSDELETYLNTLPIVACLFISDRANAYESVAASRRRAIFPITKFPCTDEIKTPTPSAPLMNDPTAVVPSAVLSTGTVAPSAPSSDAALSLTGMAAPTGATPPTGAAASVTSTGTSAATGTSEDPSEDPTVGGARRSIRRTRRTRKPRKTKYRIESKKRRSAKFPF
jgi:hypothetical protein